MIKKVYSKKKEERTIIKLDSKIATFVLLPIKRREEKRREREKTSSLGHRETYEKWRQK